MFVLAEKHSFAPDAQMCWLSVLCGYNSDAFSWRLHLQSQSATVQFPNEAKQASFAISISPPLGIKGWQGLSECLVEFSPASLACGFQFHCGQSAQWEDLISLNLRFGQAREARIEVWAEGRGCVESAPDLFLSGEVDFRIHTWVDFRGLAINVPLNASDPHAYAEARIKALWPQYSFSAPQLRKTSDSGGVVRAVEVLFSPR